MPLPLADIRFRAVAICALACCACAPPAEDAQTSRTIRVAYLGDVNFGDLPSLLAHERLRGQGYTIEETRYSAIDLVVEAVANGTAEIGTAATTAAWTAVARGAHVTTLMEHAVNPYRLVSVADVSRCVDLKGRLLAVSEAGVSTVFARRFLAEECPETQPNVSYIQDAGNRVAGLLAGGIDAAVIDMSQVLWLEEQAPGRFAVLSNFAERWPGIRTLGVIANADFAAGNRDLVVEYVRARLAANRDMQDERLVVAEAERHLGPSPRWPHVTRAYLEARTWATDGGLSEADVARTLEFFGSATLKPALGEAVADLTFLEEADAAGEP